MWKTLLLVVLALRFAELSCHGQPDAPYSQRKDVVFENAHGVGLMADLFIPNRDSNGRAIVVVASGAWSSDRGKIRDLSRSGLFDVFCSRGYHVFAIRPGSISRFSAADMTRHVEAGIRWVKAQAAEYEFDPKHLGLFGASAGGHLACLVAVDNHTNDAKTDASVAAVGVFFPPTDFLDYGGQRLNPRKTGRIHSILAQLTFRDGFDHFTDEQISQATRKISPARLVTKGLPPFMLIHGDADSAVPLQQSQRMLDALVAAQVEATLVVKEGGGHPWPTVREEIVLMAEWFDSKLVAIPAQSNIQ